MGPIAAYGQIIYGPRPLSYKGVPCDQAHNTHKFQIHIFFLKLILYNILQSYDMKSRFDRILGPKIKVFTLSNLALFEKVYKFLALTKGKQRFVHQNSYLKKQ